MGVGASTDLAETTDDALPNMKTFLAFKHRVLHDVKFIQRRHPPQLTDGRPRRELVARNIEHSKRRKVWVQAILLLRVACERVMLPSTVLQRGG